MKTIGMQTGASGACGKKKKMERGPLPDPEAQARNQTDHLAYNTASN